MICRGVSLGVFFAEGGEDFFEAAGISFGVGADFLGGSKGADLAAMKDADAVGEAFGGVQDLSRVNNSVALGGGGAGFAFEGVDAMGIHAGGKGLVEKPNLGVQGEERGEGAFVALAARHGGEGSVGDGEEIEVAEHLDGTVFACGRVDFVKAENHADVPDEGPGVEDWGEVREELKAFAEVHFAAREGLVVVKDLAVVRADDAGEEAKEGGFARAIGSEKSDDLAGLDGQGDLIESGAGFVFFEDAAEFNVHRRQSGTMTRQRMRSFREGRNNKRCRE